MNKWLIFFLGSLVGLGLAIGFYFGYGYFQANFDLINPLVSFGPLKKELPLNKYQISGLRELPIVQGELQLLELLAETDSYSSYLYSVDVSGGSMSGQLNLPKNFSKQRVVLMMRGYIPAESYQTGAGTKAAASVFAQHGLITVAPDFLGFGQSSPDLADSWESRFIKPVQMMELIADLRRTDFTYLECQFRVQQENEAVESCSKTAPTTTLGIWAHSNGGQIALTTLEGLGESLPTTLWAPVTAPFPYSVLFFTDEMPDEGKTTRLWLSQFERDYDVFAFSLTKHLDLLRGPILIHHGTNDEAALLSWSLEFADRIEAENERREQALAEAKAATESGETTLLEPIAFELLTYEGADHNLKPVWNTVVLRDVQFFAENLR